MTMSFNGTTGLVFPDSSTQPTAANGNLGFRNRIINGAMMIDQRNAGASVTPTSGQYTVDRFRAYLTQASKYSVQQNAGSVTPPAGFTNYLGITSLSAYSVGASDFFLIDQVIEGFNIADLAWGTANAKAITLSFWVYSSLTGTFGGSLKSQGGYSYPFSYTVSSANTWTQITLNIAGPTGGSWNTTNGAGIDVFFGLGVGSTNSGAAGSWQAATYYSATGATSVVGTSGATFYITGVQLEKGSTATSFDYRPYGTELALCQRYYWQTPSAGYTMFMFNNGSTRLRGMVPLPIPMRAAPSLSVITSNSFYVYNGGAAGAYSSVAAFSCGANSNNAVVDISVTGTVSGPYDWSAVLGFSSEL